MPRGRHRAGARPKRERGLTPKEQADINRITAQFEEATTDDDPSQDPTLELPLVGRGGPEPNASGRSHASSSQHEAEGGPSHTVATSEGYRNLLGRAAMGRPGPAEGIPPPNQ